MPTSRVLIPINGAGAAGPVGPVGPSGSAGTPAPNIISTTAAAAYFLNGNISSFGFSGVITLPTSDPNYSHLLAIQVMAFGPGAVVGTQIAWLPAPYSGSTVSYSGGQFTQPTTNQVWTLYFIALNEYDSPTASPVSASVTVQASAVTAVSGAFSASNNTVDPITRQVHAHPTFIPTMNAGIVPQVDAFWLSQDGGTTYGFYGNVTINTVGQSFAADTIAPTTSQTWKFACLAGWFSYSSSVPIPAGSLPAGVVFSGNITISALPLPSATDVTVLTVVAGVAGSFPYNTSNPDGAGQYWCIPNISYSDSGCLSDVNAWVVSITAQDLSASKAAVTTYGPKGTGEHVTGLGGLISQTGVTNYYPAPGLEGEYDIYGLPYVRSSPIAYVRLRVYVCNRADQSSNPWANSLAATLQTGIGGGLGYVDVEVAAGGADPPGLIQMDRADPNTIGPGLTQTSAKLQLGTGNVANSLMNPGFDDQNPATGTAAHWTMEPNGGTATVISSPGVALSGNYMLQLHGGTPSYAQSDFIAVVYQQVYYIQGWVLSDSGANGTAAIYAAWYDHTGTFVSSVAVFSGVPAPGPSAWVSYGGTVTVPANVSSMALQPQIAGNTTNNWYFDSLYVIPQVSTGLGTQPNGSGGVQAQLATPLTTVGNAITLANNSITAPYMGVDAITTANSTTVVQALALVDSIIASVGLNKLAATTLTQGTAIFTGDAIFSRGSGNPLVDLSSTGMFLYSTAVSGGGSGLTSSPYVAIQSSGIGLWLNAGGPNLTMNSTAITITNGSFVATIGASEIKMAYSASVLAVLNASFLTITNGSYSVQLSSSNIILSSSAGQTLSLSSSAIQIANGSYALTANASSIVLTNGAGTTATLSAGSFQIQATSSDYIQIVSGSINISSGGLTSFISGNTLDINLINVGQINLNVETVHFPPGVLYSSANPGSNTLPSNPAGFIYVGVGSSHAKIPYYAF